MLPTDSGHNDRRGGWGILQAMFVTSCQITFGKRQIGDMFRTVPWAIPPYGIALLTAMREFHGRTTCRKYLSKEI